MRTVLIQEFDMPPKPGLPDTLLVATLTAMSQFSQSLRDDTGCSVLAMRVARCLDALADCTALAPALRRDCEQLASLWAVLRPVETRPRAVRLPGSTPARAAVVLLRRPPVEATSPRHADTCSEEQS
jgi:hypothetical protein